MLARLLAAAVFGIEAVPVFVEVDVSPGLPGVNMVGLPDATVRESRDRVRAAIRNSGFPFPPDRVTVSLAPADLRKVGAAFDLPIALGILAASGVLPHREGTPATIVGGLSLDGAVPPMRGLLPIAMSARARGGSLVFPAGNLTEAGIVQPLRLFPVQSLVDAVNVLVSPNPNPSAPANVPPAPRDAPSEDLSDVHGQPMAKRALEVAAAGGHHLLMTGPPGAGKTMLARRLPGILPDLDVEQALTVTTIHSVAGLVAPGHGLLSTRPFRAPHHTASYVSLVGGGAIPRPGELSLAHGGVLFLDEIVEFSRQTLETLRQPLEQGSVHIARAQRVSVFPAGVMLVATMNPCPCGYLGTEVRVCHCSHSSIDRYQRRLSGPLRDRFDLTLDVPPTEWEHMADDTLGERSATVRTRVVAARERQSARQGCLNSRLDGAVMREACRLTSASANRVLRQGTTRLKLSARGIVRALRIARTAADLAGRSDISPADLAEALQFRGSG